MAQPVILLVEDDPNDEELVRIALEENSVKNHLVVVRDGSEALDYLLSRGRYAGRSPDELPQVVLLDLKLPKVSGLEVLRELRAQERTRHLPVVIFTSSKEERDVTQGYELGANAYVAKPVDFAEFSAAVQQLGMFWVLLNRPPPGLQLPP